MSKKAVFAMFVLLMLATIMISTMPVRAWEYQDGTPSDTKYEKFGPRADNLLIKLYSTPEDEFEALARGEIDITDSSLSKPYYDMFTSPPYNEIINVISYGAEYGFFMLDINNNNNPYLGNPPNPAHPNPVYPNPCSVLSFRQAIAHLVNRIWLDEIIGAEFYVPIWVPMSPALGKYYLNISNPYPYDLTTARDLLDDDGFPVNPATGWRYWDINGNGVEEPNERLELRFVIRSDHSHLTMIGIWIADQLGAVNIRVNRIYADASAARILVILNRDFHLYTGSYGVLKPDPTYLYTCFHSSMIQSTNYNSINDMELDYWLDALVNAQSQDEAVIASHNAQQVFVDKSFKVPLWAYVGYKAMYRRYTGGTAGNPVEPDDGENQYRNATWQGVVNIAGYGIDNFWSFLNMHPTGYAYGDGGHMMRVRHGFACLEIMSLNPIYASNSRDWQVLDLIYDRLIRRNPYGNFNEPEWMPWMVKNFTIGEYVHPIYGTCTKVKFTLRTDVTWNDGTPLTTADVYFTLVELKQILEAHGFPPPSWLSNVQDILSFKITDPYNFEVLFDAMSYWAISCIGDTPILPKHIWKPIIELGNPTGFAPDPNMIGSGSWRFREYMSTAYVDLVANKPGSIVQTNLPGSIPIQSPYGYFRLYPLYVNVKSVSVPYSHRIPAGIKQWKFNVTLENLIQEAVVFENVTPVDLTNPISSEWDKKWPLSSGPYYLTDWIDDNQNGRLDIGDVIGMLWDGSGIWEWYHVEILLYMPPGPIILRLNPVVIATKYLYIDGMLIDEPLEIFLEPGIPHEQQWTYFSPTIGRHVFEAKIHIEEPNWDSWKLQCKWINYTFTFWVTIREDICGSTLYDDIGFGAYPYKGQLPSPDIKVRVDDVLKAALAFGSNPGHPRWDTVADVNGDYKIRVDDVLAIALKFGWPF